MAEPDVKVPAEIWGKIEFFLRGLAILGPLRASHPEAHKMAVEINRKMDEMFEKVEQAEQEEKPNPSESAEGEVGCP